MEHDTPITCLLIYRFDIARSLTHSLFFDAINGEHTNYCDEVDIHVVAKISGDFCIVQIIGHLPRRRPKPLVYFGSGHRAVRIAYEEPINHGTYRRTDYFANVWLFYSWSRVFTRNTNTFYIKVIFSRFDKISIKW